MKRILVISWFFPPINSSEAQLTEKLLKYSRCRKGQGEFQNLVGKGAVQHIHILFLTVQNDSSVSSRRQLDHDRGSLAALAYSVHLQSCLLSLTA